MWIGYIERLWLGGEDLHDVQKKKKLGVACWRSYAPK